MLVHVYENTPELHSKAAAKTKKYDGEKETVTVYFLLRSTFKKKSQWIQLKPVPVRKWSTLQQVLWCNHSSRRTRHPLDHQAYLYFVILTLRPCIMLTGENATWAPVDSNDNNQEHSGIIALAGVWSEDKTKRQHSVQQTKKLLGEESLTGGVWKNVPVGEQSDCITGWCFDSNMTVVYCREIMVKNPSRSPISLHFIVHVVWEAALSLLLTMIQSLKFSVQCEITLHDITGCQFVREKIVKSCETFV